MLSARKTRIKPPVYCSVVVGTTGPDDWLAGTDAERCAAQQTDDPKSGAAMIQAAIEKTIGSIVVWLTINWLHTRIPGV